MWSLSPIRATINKKNTPHRACKKGTPLTYDENTNTTNKKREKVSQVECGIESKTTYIRSKHSCTFEAIVN
jgi:hypothetical protein